MAVKYRCRMSQSASCDTLVPGGSSGYVIRYGRINNMFLCVLSGWDPVTSAYFCFVTLTTIGFGDFTPVDSFAGTV